MNDPLPDEKLDQPVAPATLDPATAGILAKARWLMLISGVTTLVAIAAVTGVIGYRVFRNDGSAKDARDVTAMLPKGARVVAISVADDRIVVTIELSGALEARLFDTKTLAPAGRLRFAIEP
jgi:hypothetical protein